jgi:broad specificity phosphatase PhoE
MTEVKITRWWWVRHAPVTADGGRVYGQADPPANVSDQETFRALAAMLPRRAVWVASHLQRTHQTAEAVAAQGLAKPELLIENDLAEQCFGDWQGQVRAEIYSKHGLPHNFWLAPARTRPPGGESFVEVIERVTRCVERLSPQHAGRDVVAFAHGGTIRAALAYACGCSPESALSFAIDNLSVTRLDHIDPLGPKAAWRVNAVNMSPRLGRPAMGHAGGTAVA